jgi:hypothetical protein
MNTSAKTISLLAATLLAFVTSAKAQLQTYETVSAWTGSNFTFSAGATQGQTFSNLYAVKSMTYNFFTTGVAAATNLTAVFGQWNGSSFISGTTVSFGTITIPASNGGSWSTLNTTYGLANNVQTFAYTLDLATFSGSPISGGSINSINGYLTNPANTYALMLTNTGGNSNLGLGLTNSNVFAYGATQFGFNDWAFSQLVVSPTPTIPESSTVASVAAGLLVAGLVGYRVRQRRNQSAEVAPLAAA